MGGKRVGGVGGRGRGSGSGAACVVGVRYRISSISRCPGGAPGVID